MGKRLFASLLFRARHFAASLFRGTYPPAPYGTQVKAGFQVRPRVVGELQVLRLTAGSFELRPRVVGSVTIQEL